VEVRAVVKVVAEEVQEEERASRRCPLMLDSITCPLSSWLKVSMRRASPRIEADIGSKRVECGIAGTPG
jgi:hypothetical protein